MNILLDPGYQALILRGLGMTLLISAIVIVVSNLLALPLAIYMLQPKARLRSLVVGYSFLARAVPVLAILFALYYGLPRFGIYLEPVPSALVGLIFASAAYNMEFLRSGFESIPKGQFDAARALGLKTFPLYFKVVIPQAYRIAAPSLFSNAIQMVKGSSLASLVTVDELTAASTTIISDTYKAIEVLSAVAVLYLAIAALIILAEYAYERGPSRLRA